MSALATPTDSFSLCALVGPNLQSAGVLCRCNFRYRFRADAVRDSIVVIGRSKPSKAANKPLVASLTNGAIASEGVSIAILTKLSTAS